MKYTNDFKLKVYQSDYWRLIKDYRKTLIEKDKEYGSFDFLYWCFNYRKVDDFLDCSLLMKESRRRKTKRVREKIEDLVINHNAVFITLTFNDDILGTTTEKTRRRYVSRYLKDNCSCYVANIDYGSGKGREHYHAVVSNDIDFNWWTSHCGFIYAERVKPREDSKERVSRYITKLTNHALKVSDITPRLIYSRDSVI